MLEFVQGFLLWMKVIYDFFNFDLVFFVVGLKLRFIFLNNKSRLMVW